MQSKLTLVIFILFVFGKSASAETEHVHNQHNHDTTATPSAAVATERYEGFVKDLKDSKVAVINVIGMVCDFCARGIEKTFNKDEFVRVDLWHLSWQRAGAESTRRPIFQAVQCRPDRSAP